MNKAKPPQIRTQHIAKEIALILKKFKLKAGINTLKPMQNSKKLIAITNNSLGGVPT